MDVKFSPLDDRFLTRRQTAQKLGFVSPRSVFRLEKQGKIKRVPFYGHARYRLSDILSLIEKGGVS